MKRVVLALGHRENSNLQMKFSSIYVALSRVRSSADIRILLPPSSNRDPLAYIANLKPDRDVQDYYCGFDTCMGELWDHQKSLQVRATRISSRS